METTSRSRAHLHAIEGTRHLHEMIAEYMTTIDQLALHLREEELEEHIETGIAKGTNHLTMIAAVHPGVNVAEAVTGVSEERDHLTMEDRQAEKSYWKG